MNQNTDTILAVITVNKDKVSGGAPIFFARNEEELVSTSNNLSRILDATVHELESGTYILVKHG
ncbi:MAG TPA: hypothetical protein PL078_03360 [Bacillota bacterium]|jgi:hypothetical protein|nr:hypothetical protein [Peptococcaceae bacterium MAG4]NLW38145.1 hypothetical protein [Peptococcaceae bacterium]HPU35265.1 hypothetical protein [Bacillota bacterium]HPZ43022.1 hypothetical protein [Bacillota bacterium]HQD75551.1 hypothetical protein [Bacillota bacterium]